MKKLSLILIGSFLVATQTFAATGTTSTGTNLITDLNRLLGQYESQLKYLQAENSILRNEISKAGIKIPLSEFPSSVSTETSATVTGSTTTTGNTETTTRSVSGEFEVALGKIETTHGKRYRGFITGITPNWSAIKNAYKLPADASILGYEFVKKGDDDHVFVDISFGERSATATGVYDAKILYQYNTTTFARKLIGLFIYDTKSKYYVTKTGTNPFAGVPRTFVTHPQIDGLGTTTTTTTASTTTTTSTGTVTTTGPSTVTLEEIEKSYTDKRYLSVITLSNSYLTSNPATYDLLRIRYRTYFIIGKYTESLGEIEKIKALGRLDKSVACDAQVIATYGKNTELVNTYTSICKAK